MRLPYAAFFAPSAEGTTGGCSKSPPRVIAIRARKQGVIGCDLTDRDAVARLLARVRPRLVYHLAGSFSNDYDTDYPLNTLAARHLIEAADIQLRMEATGGELIEIPSQICESTAAQYEKHDSGRGSADWPAFLRIADQIDPSYRH